MDFEGGARHHIPPMCGRLTQKSPPNQLGLQIVKRPCRAAVGELSPSICLPFSGRLGSPPLEVCHAEHRVCRATGGQAADRKRMDQGNVRAGCAGRVEIVSALALIGLRPPVSSWTQCGMSPHCSTSRNSILGATLGASAGRSTPYAGTGDDQVSRAIDYWRACGFLRRSHGPSVLCAAVPASVT
jgi:hypothetical protein